MIFSISWRNIWRNKVRSLVIITAIALGIFAGVLSAAFFKGMADQRIQKVINNELSYIQIHKPGFRQTSDFSDFLPDADNILNKTKEMQHVTGVSKRILVQSMVASAETAAGVMIMGVDPEAEKKVTTLNEKIIDGEYFDGIGRNPVVVGKKLAEKLNLKVKSKVVITLQDLNNNITSGAFRVAGIFSTDNNMYDESHIFIRYDDMARLTSFPETAAHEIAVNIDNSENLILVQDELKNFAVGDEVMNWKELSPEMNYLTEIMDLYMYIFIIIILLALLFGIINTMLMVVMERTKELGMLMAIGMNKRRIFGMIVLESILLSLTGGVIGIFVGAFASWYFGIHPIDLSMWAEGYQQLGYDAFVYTTVQPTLLVNVAIMVIFTGVIAAIYPAYKALKNNPADALRIE